MRLGKNEGWALQQKGSEKQNRKRRVKESRFG